MMRKKIVVLNGSPRKTGNTSALIKAFTEGAKSAGNNVTEFFLDRMDIHGKPEIQQAYELGKSI